jgi:hypothetical protein
VQYYVLVVPLLQMPTIDQTQLKHITRDYVLHNNMMAKLMAMISESTLTNMCSCAGDEFLQCSLALASRARCNISQASLVGEASQSTC